MNSSCYCISLRKANRRLTALYDEALAPFGITVGQFSELRHIRHRQPVSLTDLADCMELDRSTVGRNTKVLQKMKLVVSKLGVDQRESVLSLTEEGTDMLRRTEPVWHDIQEKIEGKLGLGETERLLELLATL
jgi:DNA-binding MarR family transcriptional regulator